MLLDAETLDLAPRAAEVLARLDGDARFKPELPAAQLELLTAPAGDIAGLASSSPRAGGTWPPRRRGSGRSPAPAPTRSPPRRAS